MKERILSELKKRIEKDYNKGPLFRMGYINLQMKKFVMDIQDEDGKEEFDGDCLSISYPDCLTNKFRLIAEFAKPEFESEKVSEVSLRKKQSGLFYESIPVVVK